MYVIRKAGVADLHALHELERLCFREERWNKGFIKFVLKSEHALTFVYENKELIGSIMVVFHPSYARIISIAVHPMKRKRGYGTKLLKEAENEIAKRNLTQIKLEVKVNNEVAIKFYQARGYRVERIIAGYYPDGTDAYCMVKVLNPKFSSDFSR